MTLALFAMGLTSAPVWAQQKEAKDPGAVAGQPSGGAAHQELQPPVAPAVVAPVVASAAALPAEPPAAGLTLRPSKPIALAESTSSSGWWWKLLACAGIAGGAVFVWKRRALLQPPQQGHTLRIVTRTPVGVRSEIVIVDVDGQKLLLGVTPGSIQRLAVIGEPELAPAPEPAVAEEADPGFARFVEQARERLERFQARSNERVPLPSPLPGRGRESDSPPPSRGRESEGDEQALSLLRLTQSYAAAAIAAPPARTKVAAEARPAARRKAR